jgi:ribosome maturation factor RimP
MGAEEQIADALRPIVRAAGLEIWDVESTGTSVRVLVERPGGIDLDSISELSRSVSTVLDERDDLVPNGRYTLEVSSPGLERRLRYPRHFASYIGHDVAIKTASPVNGVRRLTGTLAEATDEEIVLQAALATGETEEVRVPLELIDRANAVFTWGAPAKPQKSAKPTKTNRAARRADAAGPGLADAATVPAPEEAL